MPAEATVPRVPRETSICTRCRDEPRVPGQRWGKRCRAAAQRAYRARVTAERRAAAWSAHD